MRNFLIVTEKGRKRGKISFYIAEIKENGLNLIDNDFTVIQGMHRGLKHEAIKRLVDLKYLDSKYINESGYIEYKNVDFNIILVEGQGLNYIG